MRPASAGRHARLAGAGLARSRVRGRGVRGGAYVCRPGARRRAKPLGLFSISCYTAPVDDAFSHAGLHNQSLTRLANQDAPPCAPIWSLVTKA